MSEGESTHVINHQNKSFQWWFRTACVAGRFIGDAGGRGLETKEWKCEQKLGKEFGPILLSDFNAGSRSNIPWLTLPNKGRGGGRACWRANLSGLFDIIALMKKHPVVPALISLRPKVAYFLNVTLKIVKSMQFKRVLSDVAAMLSSSGYKTLYRY